MIQKASILPGTAPRELTSQNGETCTPEYFERWLKDRPLTLMWEMKELACVIDADEISWTIKRSCLHLVPTYNTVGQEMTGRKINGHA